MTLEENIDRILGYKTWSNERKEDALLEIDASLYTELGTDSTKSERQEVKRKSRKIYTAIEQVSPFWGNYFLLSLDK